MNKHWKIEVVSWGVLWAFGTEEQAEAWRRHKARWEGCIARKKQVTPADLPDGEKWTRLSEVIG